jgi:hypothetical protein
MKEDNSRALAAVGEAAVVAIGEVVRGERGGPGAGKTAALDRGFCRQPRQDVHDDVVGEPGARQSHVVDQWSSHRS